MMLSSLAAVYLFTMCNKVCLSVLWQDSTGTDSQGRDYIGAMEPEPTKHSTPTFVWAYIARHVCATFKSDVSVQTYSYSSYTVTEPVGLFALSFHLTTTLLEHLLYIKHMISRYS